MLYKKLRITILLFLIALLYRGCSRNSSPFSPVTAPHHFNALKSLETLSETDPAAALDSLVSFSNEAAESEFTDLDENEFLLRVVQIQYKNRSLDDDCPDLAPVIVFYDSLVDLFPNDAELRYLLANTYYYKGAECAFADNDVDAFQNYLNALKQMNSCEDWDENTYAQRFIALAFTRVSEILYRYGLYDEAMETCHQAFLRFKSDVDQAAMMRYEAAIYQAEKEYDNALASFRQAEALAPFDDDAYQFALGAKLFELQQYDSAYPYLKRAFAAGDPKVRVEAAAMLAEICRIEGKADEELHYTRFYVESSMRESRLTSKKMEIDYLYDVYSNTEGEEKPVQSRDNSPVVILMLVLVVVIGFLAFVIVRNRHRITHIENQISDIEERHRKEKADKEQEINQIAQQLSDTRAKLQNVTNHTFEEAWTSFNESAIVNKIKENMEGTDIMIKNVGLFPKLKLKEVDMIELVRTVNANFTDCSQRFLNDFPDLNSADFRQCCLAMLGMNDAQMAVLEGISYSGVNRRTKKIIGAMKTESTLEQAFLTYLRNNW